MMDLRELAGLILATSVGIALIIFIVGIVRSGGLTITTTGDECLFLEKALAQAMETNLQLQVIEAPCILNGVSPNHIGKECVTFGGYYPGEVLGLADEYKELAQWLRERDNNKMEEQK